MKQKTIATRHLRTKIAAGYVLILFVIFGIVYIWLNEQHRRQELEITSQKIRCLRKDIHEVYVKMVDLSLIGETVLDWNEEDMNIYHKKRLEVDSLLSLFKSSYRSERIDSVCRLLAEKENLLNKIMLVLNEQEEIKDKIARRVPVIARKSSQEEPPKRKRTGFLGLFGKKEEAKPTVTTSMLNTLNSDVITRQKEQSERLSQYTDSLSVRNRKLNCQLQGMIKKMDARIRTDLQQQETELAAIRRQSSVQVGGLTAVVALLLLLSYFIIHRNVKRISQYKKETNELIDKLQKTVEQNKQLLTARRKIMLTVTHELRTPLTAINGYGELLAQTENENKRIEYTQNIRQATGRMTDIKNLTGSGNLVLGEITLTDDEGISEYAGYHLKLKSKKVTYVRALSDNSQYGTICLPFVPTSVAGGQVTYYQVLELESDEITLVETDFEAGKPLFYQTSGTGDITFSAESAAGVELVTTPATDSFMVGTMSEVIPNAGYFLKNGNIYPIANGDKVKVKPFRAYVKGQNDASQASVMSVNVARP